MTTSFFLRFCLLNNFYQQKFNSVSTKVQLSTKVQFSRQLANWVAQGVCHDLLIAFRP